MTIRLRVEDVSGVYSIMPTPATPQAADPGSIDTVDYNEAGRAADALVNDGVDAIMTNGTFGEGATLTWDEHRTFAATVIDAVAGRVPVLIGATTLNTRDTISRARVFSDLGADGLLLGRPMWSPCDDDTTIAFYSAVAEFVPELAIVAYDNPVAFRGPLSSRVFARLSMIEQVVAVKYRTLGDAFSSDIEAAGDRLRILPLDREWERASRMFPGQIWGCWSGSASCGPSTIVALRRAMESRDMVAAVTIGDELARASETFFPEGSFELFSRYNIQLEKIRIDEAGYMAAGPSRPPYADCPDDYAEGARESGRRLARLNAKYHAMTSERNKA